MSRVTELRVNGKHRAMDANEESRLISVLRDQLNLIGTQYGSGERRACTVLLTQAKNIREFTQGNFGCCGGCLRIIEGVRRAAAAIKESHT
ncbi:MAG: hypothetical protein M1404_07335 [Acidobacteria bacterium]|nr:hypothetical protein [Acidobacteriota bacterium]